MRLLPIVGIDGEGFRVFKICVYGISDLRIDGVRAYTRLPGFYPSEKICYPVKIQVYKKFKIKNPLEVLFLVLNALFLKQNRVNHMQ